MKDGYLNKIYHCDCIDGMQKLDEKSVDLIITSPPYNVDKDYDVYNDFKHPKDYLKWSSEWISGCFRVLKDGGRFCLNIADMINQYESPLSILLGSIAIERNFRFYAKIIWIQNDRFNSTAWGSWKSPSCPAFINNYENILIFYKGDKKISGEGADIKGEEFKEWVRTIWQFSSELDRKYHPAPFPIELPYRLVKLLSFKNAIVLDPFMGSGSTAYACKVLGRNFIGFDISKLYCDIARDRTSFTTLGDWNL